MDSVPARKFGADLLQLEKIDWDQIIPGKIYYIRVRNKDQSKNVWGLKQDIIGRINLIDDAGVSFDTFFYRNMDPRNGSPSWKKKEGRMLILKEALTIKNLNNNTTFYIESKTKNTTRRKRARSMRKK